MTNRSASCRTTLSQCRQPGPGDQTLAPCSHSSRPLRAASGGGLRPALTSAARRAPMSCGRDEETACFGRTKKLTVGYQPGLKCRPSTRLNTSTDTDCAVSPPHPKFAFANFDLSPQAGRGGPSQPTDRFKQKSSNSRAHADSNHPCNSLKLQNDLWLHDRRRHGLATTAATPRRPTASAAMPDGPARIAASHEGRQTT